MSLLPRQSRVLVVDDDPVVLEALSGMMALRLPGLTVDTASSGEAALSCLRRRVYDALVTDLLMPGMTGLHLMEEVAAFECPPALLLMTAHPNPAGYTLRGHGFTFVKKPIDRDSFVQALASALRDRRFRRRLHRLQRRQQNTAEVVQYLDALRAKRTTIQAVLRQMKESLKLSP